MSDRDLVVLPASLIELGAGVLRAAGVPAPDAHLVADSLVMAELWGHPSHGMLRLPWYVNRLRSGVMRPVTEVVVLNDLGALVSLDGNDGVGQVIADRIMRTAVERARSHGVGVAGVRNSNHFGTAAYFTRRAADEGCAAILTTNSSPAMAPLGGREKFVGANPWSLAAPAGLRGTAVLDLANTAVARGKLYAASQAGQQIPDDWALDREGRPTTDPAAALDEGFVLPMAGHKGYAISFMMDVFSGVLTGSGVGREIVGPYRDDARSRVGHLAIAIDIEAFRPSAEFNERMERYIDDIKSVPVAPGVEQICFPGELEDRNAVRRAEAGIALPALTVSQLRQLAADSGMALELEVLPGRRGNR